MRPKPKYQRDLSLDRAADLIQWGARRRYLTLRQQGQNLRAYCQTNIEQLRALLRAERNAGVQTDIQRYFVRRCRLGVQLYGLILRRRKARPGPARSRAKVKARQPAPLDLLTAQQRVQQPPRLHLGQNPARARRQRREQRARLRALFRKAHRRFSARLR